MLKAREIFSSYRVDDDEIVQEMPDHQAIDPYNPTHTQLAKDHDEHPLHKLAVECAKIMVEDMGKVMKDVWNNHSTRDESFLCRRADAYFTHPYNINEQCMRPLLEIQRLCNYWMDENPREAMALPKYKGDLTHAKHELRELAEDASGFSQQAFEYIKEIYERF